MFPSDGSTVVACGDTNVLRRDSLTGAVRASFELGTRFPHYHDHRLSVSSDGKLLAAPAYPTENCAALISLRPVSFWMKSSVARM